MNESINPSIRQSKFEVDSNASARPRERVAFLLEAQAGSENRREDWITFSRRRARVSTELSQLDHLSSL
jgi:hypothetical protein